MSEETEPDWLAELAKGGEALRRQVESVTQAAERLVQGARRRPTRDGPVPPFQQRVVRAVDAVMRELVPPRERPVVHHVTASDTATAVETMAVVITSSGGVTLPPIRFDGQGTVENPPGRLAGLSDGQIVALVLVWLYAFVLPWLGAALPPEFHAVLSDHYATIAIALGITWRMLDKRK